MSVLMQLVLRDEYVKNFLYMVDLDAFADIYVRACSPPFDGWFVTFVSSMIPIFNLAYLMYYYIIIFSDDLEELKVEIDKIKNGK